MSRSSITCLDAPERERRVSAVRPGHVAPHAAPGLRSMGGVAGAGLHPCEDRGGEVGVSCDALLRSAEADGHASARTPANVRRAAAVLNHGERPRAVEVGTIGRRRVEVTLHLEPKRNG